MRIPILILFLIVFSNRSDGQCYSKTTIPYAPTTFSGAPVILGDNEFSPMIPLGFSFCFYGQVFDSITIYSNGLVSFASYYAGLTWNVWAQPLTQLPNPYATPSPKMCIMCPWQNLNPSLGGSITYSMSGTAPFRAFNVSYVNVPMDSCGSTFTGQIRIFEYANEVETHILNRDTCSASGDNAIHGLHDYGYIDDIVPGRNFPAQWVTNNEGMRFTPICNVCTGVGIADNFADNSCAISPRPAVESTTIILPNKSDYPATITLYDVEGKEVRQITGLKTDVVIVTRDGLRAGIYIFTVAREGLPTLTGKLVFVDE